MTDYYQAFRDWHYHHFPRWLNRHRGELAHLNVQVQTGECSLAVIAKIKNPDTRIRRSRRRETTLAQIDMAEAKIKDLLMVKLLPLDPPADVDSLPPLQPGQPARWGGEYQRIRVLFSGEGTGWTAIELLDPPSNPTLPIPAAQKNLHRRLSIESDLLAVHVQSESEEDEQVYVPAAHRTVIWRQASHQNIWSQ